MGYSKGKEYTEIPFPFDMGFGLLEISVAGNLFSTFVRRREQQLILTRFNKENSPFVALLR